VETWNGRISREGSHRTGNYVNISFKEIFRMRFRFTLVPFKLDTNFRTVH
jgi:hypothetical protein